MRISIPPPKSKLVGSPDAEHETETMPGSAEGDKPDALKLVDDAKASGKLDGLQQVLDDHGWPTPAEDFIMLAQNDDRTAGKAPDELADMLQADGSLYDDVEATKPGGALAPKGKTGAEGSSAEEASEDPAEAAAEGDEIQGQMKNPMSARDKGRAPGVLKGMGKKAGDLGSFDTKAKMMEKLAGR